MASQLVLPKMAQYPEAHACPLEQAFPHPPQFALSVCVSTQYGAPPSGVQRVCPVTQLEAQTPPEQTCCAPQT